MYINILVVYTIYSVFKGTDMRALNHTQCFSMERSITFKLSSNTYKTKFCKIKRPLQYNANNLPQRNEYTAYKFEP